MKKTLLSILTLLALTAQAQTQDVATVVSVQPRYVTVQQQQCGTQEVVRDNSRADSTIGALAGAAIGSTIGGNNRDRLAGGVVGALIGGSIGNSIGEQNQARELRKVCQYVPVTIQQGSVVTFSYHGQMFTQQFAQ